MAIKALVIGGGGREHAIAWALAKSPRIEHIFVAPGNGGIQWAADPAASRYASCQSIGIAAEAVNELVSFAQRENVLLTIVGPEAALAAGVVDAFEAVGLPVFGPTRAAAQLEISKAFAKDFMRAHNIPTMPYRVFQDYAAASAYVKAVKHAVVVKADGLAAGKGVVVCDSGAEADAALRRIMLEREFGAAGERVVIEERAYGRELSVLAFSDGLEVCPMPPARDHKRIYDGDKGPNTGGMGVYSPVPDIDATLYDRIYRTIIAPTIWSMSEDGIPYSGVLYAGLILTKDGPRVLEYNCRFGDPETQALLPLLESDFADLIIACVEKHLFDYAYSGNLRWKSGACVNVVLAAEGYPATVQKGALIEDHPASDAQSVVFYAGVRRDADQLYTDGGRVLSVSAWGTNLSEAQTRAYQHVARIRFAGQQYRSDIGVTDA
jgi:phosphoribosylamine---glycine ligase